jgi:hypothetical protein
MKSLLQILKSHGVEVLAVTDDNKIIVKGIYQVNEDVIDANHKAVFKYLGY